MTVQSAFTKTQHLMEGQNGAATQMAKRVSVPDNTATALFTIKQGGGARNLVCFVRLDMVLNSSIGGATEDAAARAASYLITLSDHGTIVLEQYLSASITSNASNRDIGAPTVTVAEITSDSFEIRVQVASSGTLSPFNFGAYCFATVLSNNATVE